MSEPNEHPTLTTILPQARPTHSPSKALSHSDAGKRSGESLTAMRQRRKVEAQADGDRRRLAGLQALCRSGVDLASPCVGMIYRRRLAQLTHSEETPSEETPSE